MENQKPLENEIKTTVYFDGLCHLCSREINHYRKMSGAENISFVDITDPGFDADKEGLNPHLIHEKLHARGKDGSLHVGVDAFICIWGELPKLKFLVRLAKVKPVYMSLSAAYLGFAKIRPLLPRKSCDTSPYCDIKNN